MSNTNPGYSIFVNSSDGFTDCWEPFFKLFQKYWPTCNAPIFLNTELQSFRQAKPRVSSTCVQQGLTQRLSWSECLMKGLSYVNTPLVLYFQEDYFLQSPVDQKRIDFAARYMLEHPEIKCIGLTGVSAQGPFEIYKDIEFQLIRPRANYRISTQAALWRTETLMSYLVPSENGWMFEIYGTWRAWRRSECFLCARFDTKSGGPVIDYLHTGIVKGKWLPAIQAVFKSNGISVDYTQRGFYSPKIWPLRKIETARRLLEHPMYLLSQLLRRL